MKILLSEKITVFTPISKNEAIKALALVTRKRTFAILPKKPVTGKVFEGQVFNDVFDIQRIIMYRNSFLPQIKGRFIPKAAGTEIQISLKPHALVIAFLVVWFGILGLLVLGTIFMGTKEEYPLLFAALVMMAVGGLMVHFGFSYEVKKAKKELEKVWN